MDASGHGPTRYPHGRNPTEKAAYEEIIKCLSGSEKNRGIIKSKAAEILKGANALNKDIESLDSVDAIQEWFLELTNETSLPKLKENANDMDLDISDMKRRAPVLAASLMHMAKS